MNPVDIIEKYRKFKSIIKPRKTTMPTDEQEWMKATEPSVGELPEMEIKAKKVRPIAEQVYDRLLYDVASVGGVLEKGIEKVQKPVTKAVEKVSGVVAPTIVPKPVAKITTKAHKAIVGMPFEVAKRIPKDMQIPFYAELRGKAMKGFVENFMTPKGKDYAKTYKQIEDQMIKEGKIPEQRAIEVPIEMYMAAKVLGWGVNKIEDKIWWDNFLKKNYEKQVLDQKDCQDIIRKIQQSLIDSGDDPSKAEGIFKEVLTAKNLKLKIGYDEHGFPIYKKVYSGIVKGKVKPGVGVEFWTKKPGVRFDADVKYTVDDIYNATVKTAPSGKLPFRPPSVYPGTAETEARYGITPVGKLAPRIEPYTKPIAQPVVKPGISSVLSKKTIDRMAFEELRMTGGYPQTKPYTPTPKPEKVTQPTGTRPYVRPHKPESAKTLIEKYREKFGGQEPPVDQPPYGVEVHAPFDVRETMKPKTIDVHTASLEWGRTRYPHVPIKGQEIAMGGEAVEPPVHPTPEQIAKAQELAGKKMLLSEKGKVKPQYRTLAKGITGKEALQEMSQREAGEFVNALEKLETRVVGGKELPPKVPTGKKIVSAELFQKRYRKPTLARFITPSDRYLRTLGTYETVEPLIKGKTRLEIERAKAVKHLDKLERKVLKLEKTGITEKVIKKGVRGRPTKAHEKWFNLLDKYSTAEQAKLTGESAKIFNELRGLTQGMLQRTNEVRIAVGLEPIKNMSAYVTHITDILTKEKISKKYPMPEAIKYWLDYINPKHIHNPTALKRMVSEREGLLRDPFRALKAMVSMDLRQIYLEYPNIIFRKQMKALENVIPHETRKWTEAYVNEVIKGYPTKLDNLTNNTLNRMGIIPSINWLLKPFGRSLGMNPVKKMAGTIGRLVHDATIWGRVKLVLRNHTQKFLALGLYDTKAFIKALVPANREIKNMIRNNDFFQISSKEFMEVLPKSALGKLEQIGFKPYEHSHISNVAQTMKVAYHAGMELVKKPKYKKYGWTKDDVMKEMEYGANTCQYWYNLMGMPEIYRHGTLKPFAVLQSWFQNYFMKYWREMLARGFTGKTGWGKPIPPKWRVGALRHIIASLLFTEGVRRGLGLDYKRTVLLGTLPAWLSPPGQIVAGLYEYIVGLSNNNKYQQESGLNKLKYSYRAFIPGSMAWKDYWNAWEQKNIMEALFYTEKKRKEKKPKEESHKGIKFFKGYRVTLP